jgi:hypothetical protein
MTEIEVRSSQPGEMTYEATPLMLWAMDAQEAYKVAQSLCKTSFVPSTLRGKPEEAAAAILTGAEMGLSPMAALRSIDIIQGTPAMRAHALRGLVQSRGHEVWVEDATPSRAVVCGRRKGSDITQKSTWDTTRAQGLGLMAKDNWKKMPQAMLVARATSEVCRLIASDVLLGLPYSVEELDDQDAPAVAKKVSRKKPEQQQVEPPSLEPVTDEVVEAEPEEPAAEPALDWPEVTSPGDAA